MSKSVQIDEEALGAALGSILSEINEIDDPSVLNAYRKVFHKFVPIFRRGYVAAYLLANLKPGAVTTTTRKPQPAVREGMTSIFIGVGKSRKVFPRDLMSLLMDQGGVAKDEIGNIKILDNYSFVEIQNEKSALVIEKLNNLEFRGQQLAVNYAKKRD